ALSPELAAAPLSAPAPTRLRGLRVAAAALIVIAGGAAVVSEYLPRLGLKRATPRPARVVPADAQRRAEADLARLKRFIEDGRARHRALPWDVWDLYARWEEEHPKQDGPEDPFSGYWYGYESHGNDYRVWC